MNQLSEKMHTLLRGLVTVKMRAWAMHWNSKGPSFYGDHLLLERIYTKIDKSIDALGERIVGYCGKVNGAAMSADMESVVNLRDLIIQCQVLSDGVAAELKNSGAYASVSGLENYLTDLNDKLDTFAYLLKQRSL